MVGTCKYIMQFKPLNRTIPHTHLGDTLEAVPVAVRNGFQLGLKAVGVVTTVTAVTQQKFRLVVILTADLTQLWEEKWDLFYGRSDTAAGGKVGFILRQI